jgi:hypothetical protein
LGIITNKEKIKAHNNASDSSARIYYIYEITYDDYFGKTIKKNSNTGVPENLSIGSKIEVIYDKEKTDNFLIFAKKQQVINLVMIVLGVFFIVIGISFLVFKSW